MTVWVLLAHIVATNGMMMPYLAFDSQDKCIEVLGMLDHDTQADCVLFGADRGPNPDPDKR